MARLTLLGLVLATLLVGASAGVPEGPPANAGSTGSVTIYRDGFGVPHIYADTPEAAAYALGYVQAQDHLERMRLDYLTAAGRKAEFGLGTPANDNNVYRLRVPQTAQASYEALAPEHRSRIDAFVAGINRYIFEEGDNLADWISYVQPYEVLAWMHYLAMAEQSSIATSDMSGGGGGAGVQAGDASNMWAVSPSLSTLGVATLNGDPHLPWTGFTRQWYEAHLNYPGTNVAGSLFFGFPAIVMGANDNVAWTMTNNGADTADVYAETVNPENPFQYLRDGRWVSVQAETVTIKEKVGDDIAEQTFTNYYSVHGPLIGAEPGIYYAAAMSSFDNVVSRLILFDANEATSIDAVLEPSQPPDMHKWNIIVADRAGNISYVWSARVAHKPESIDWSQPVDGSTSANDWGPLLTIAELPQIINPSWGYLQNANNSAWTTAPNLNPDDFPSYVGGSRSGGLGDRGTRAVEILESRPQHSIQDMITMGFDTLSVRARALIPVALDVWTEVGPGTPDPNGDLQAAMDLLAGWDFVQDRESRETALGRLFIEAFYQANPSFSALNVPPADQWTQADKDKMVAALQEAADFMLTNIGPLDPLWGDVHKIQRGNQAFRVGAGNKGLPALHMANASRFQDGVWWADSGSSYIFVVAFTDPVTFYSIRPLGQSEDPSSLHFADQTQLFADEQVKQVWMTLADVQANAESSLSLTYHGSAHNTDADPCSDTAELGEDALLGGLRDPTNFWDFFDTPGASNVRDKTIDLVNDVFRVADRFDANDDSGSAPINRNTDPLSAPPPAPAYHPAFDRSPPPLGGDPWDLGPADGTIDLFNDVFGVAYQFGHSCAALP